MTFTTLFIGRYQNFFFLWVLHVNVLNFVPYSLDRMFQTKKLQRIEIWPIFSFSIFCQNYPVLDSVLYFVCNMYRKYNYIILKRKGKRLKYDMLQMVTYCTSGYTRCWKMTFCRRFDFVKTEMTFTTLFMDGFQKFLFLWILHVNVWTFVAYSLDRIFQTKKLQRIEFLLIFSFSIFCQNYPVLDIVL